MQMMLRRLLLVFACLTIAACGGKDPTPAPTPTPTPTPTPPAPDPGDPAGTVRVSGGERLGWSQQAANATEVARIQYALYIDNARVGLSGATCGGASGSDGFDCSAPLPMLTAGAHTLELAAFFPNPQGVVESGRSAPLRVIMNGLTGPIPSSTSTQVTTAEGVKLTLDRITDGLYVPSDIAFGADGAIFVAERGGTVRTIRQGALLPDPALDLSGEVRLPQGGLLAIALDPKFDETGFMYALYAVGAPRGGLEFMLARFRSVEDTFGERAILLDRIAASPSGASGALRVGPDGKLYVALDNAADSRRAGSFATYNGKVLRLNADATTPDDQPGSTPIYSLDHPQPKALDWQPVSGELWVVDGVEPSAGRLSAVTAGDPDQRRAAFRTAYTLPEGTGATSAAFYRGSLMSMFQGNLFIAAATGRQLIRLQFDPAVPTRVTSVDRLLKDEMGPVRVVSEGPDGALYLASDTALYRLRP